MVSLSDPASQFQSHVLGFISNRTQFVRGAAGDEAFQPLLSIFSFESVTSLSENVQFTLNVKEITFLICATVITG